MSENTLYIRIIEVLKKEVVYATGCTEPIALAYAAATARKYLESDPTEIAAFVSPNLMKNGMAVKVPGTGLPGMDIAVAVGVTGGDPEGGLDVLRKLTDADVEKAKELIAQKIVSVQVADTGLPLYVEVCLTADAHWVRVIIKDDIQTLSTLKRMKRLFSIKMTNQHLLPTPICLLWKH